MDESTEFRVAAFLQDQGHDVTAIAHDYPHALADEEVLALARSEQRILITNDRDFGHLIVRQHLPHAGVIYFRLPAATAQQKIERLNETLTSYAHELGSFLVVDAHRVRVLRAT